MNSKVLVFSSAIVLSISMLSLIQAGIILQEQDGKSLGGSGDYQHGLSVVGLSSNEQPKISFDLTKHGNGQHNGLFGGTFISSSKYNSDDDHAKYSSVLSTDSGHFDNVKFEKSPEDWQQSGGSESAALLGGHKFY